jgi:hypothetical protein
MMQYARAFAAAVEGELCHGNLPFDDHELVDRITGRVSALPKRNVRVIGLHVWHKGAISSRSMMAVSNNANSSTAAQNSPTVPAMPAVRGQGERKPSASPHARATVRPAQPTPRPTSVQPATAPRDARAEGEASLPTIESRPSAILGKRPSTTSESRAPVAQSAPPKSSPLPSNHAAARMASGVVPAVEPRIVRTQSGFSLALDACKGSGAQEVGQALAQPVRNAAALVLLGALEAAHGQLNDPLAILDAQESIEVRRGLIGEACVCVCYLLYEILAQSNLPRMACIEVVQGACTAALRDDSMPVSEISRYLATESPREEFSGRICRLLGVRENADLQQKVDAALRSVRLDVRTCANQIEARLTSRRAATGSGRQGGGTQEAV